MVNCVEQDHTGGNSACCRFDPCCCFLLTTFDNCKGGKKGVQTKSEVIFFNNIMLRGQTASKERK